MSTEQHEALPQLSGASLLDIKSLAAQAENAAITARSRTDTLIQAYLELQKGNVRQHALIVQMAEALEVISANNEYETEYDGRMYTQCHSCRYDELKGHQDDCEYIAARTVLAAATQYLKGPKT